MTSSLLHLVTTDETQHICVTYYLPFGQNRNGADGQPCACDTQQRHAPLTAGMFISGTSWMPFVPLGDGGDFLTDFKTNTRTPPALLWNEIFEHQTKN